MYNDTTEGFKFTFESNQLGQKLLEFSPQARTGYWKIRLDNPSRIKYLTLAQGRVIFSSSQQISWPIFRKSLETYLLKLRHPNLQKQINTLENQSTPEQLEQISLMLGKIEKESLISREEVLQTSQQSILIDLDQYLFDTIGEAEFVNDLDLITQAQIPGFRLEDLVNRANQRKAQWQQIKNQIPTIKAIPKINQNILEKSPLNPQQKQRIEKLVKAGKSLENIAQNVGKDTLEIGQFFAKIVRSGLVSLKIPPDTHTSSNKKRIFVVDDSPILLQQFQRLVAKWGYQVDICGDPLKAVETMTQIKPQLVFIDINMPGITGFELIKEIRRKSDLSSTPLVLLTAEKSVSNQWRAQWANCKFLAKPRSKDEVGEFQKELQQLLQETVPLS